MRFHGRVVAVANDPRRTLEIDDPHDLERAPALAPLLDPATDRLLSTDARVYVDSHRVEAVLCDRADGCAVDAPCTKLQVLTSYGHGDGKGGPPDTELDRRGVAASRVLHVGNDANDVDCLPSVGYPVVVADASASARVHARYALGSPGGRGALRELAEHLLGRAI